jgi:hypothetical protein
VIINFPLRKI